MCGGTLHSCAEKALNEFVCPYCGEPEIAELLWCVVLLPVARWSDEARALDYGEAEVDLESELPYGSVDESVSEDRPVYECRNCAKQFRKPSRAD
jgi:DNA-directed RNA polymerase subunit RPC12/RpoP